MEEQLEPVAHFSAFSGIYLSGQSDSNLPLIKLFCSSGDFSTDTLFEMSLVSKRKNMG